MAEDQEELNEFQILARDATEWLQEECAKRGLEITTSAVMVNGMITPDHGVFAIASTGFISPQHLIDTSIAHLVQTAIELNLPNVSDIGSNRPGSRSTHPGTPGFQI